MNSLATLTKTRRQNRQDRIGESYASLILELRQMPPEMKGELISAIDTDRKLLAFATKLGNEYPELGKILRLGALAGMAKRDDSEP